MFVSSCIVGYNLLTLLWSPFKFAISEPDHVNKCLLHGSQLALRTASVAPICNGDLTIIASYNQGQLESKEIPTRGEL